MNDNSEYNSHKKHKYSYSCSNQPSSKINISNSIKRKKQKIDKINKINLNSYFKLNEKEKNFEINNKNENNKSS